MNFKILRFTIHLVIGAFLVLSVGCRKNFLPNFEKGQGYYNKADYVAAVDALNLAIRHWEKSDGTAAKAQAYEILGLSYKELRKTDSAIQAFQSAVELSDKTYKSAYNLGIFYLASNEPELAQRSFQTALRMKNDDPEALVGLGNALFAQKKFREARDAYDRVLKTSPGVQESLKFIQIIDARGTSRKSRRK